MVLVIGFLDFGLVWDLVLGIWNFLPLARLLLLWGWHRLSVWTWKGFGMPQPVDIVGLLEAGIRAEETRQRTIASNIANLETPGYRRLDVRFEELLAKALHSGQAAGATQVEPEIFQPAGTPLKSNGNDVNMEMEIGEMLKNSFRQAAFVRLLRKKFAQIETAITIRE
ncbi:MAG: flagellar basal body rod protein FlgB [Planctomycetes bacterium]|nr:flagellar basal body rod protein FlgB [Planctomycetota bacterium]